MNISPSNIFPNTLPDKRFLQNHEAVSAALSINGFILTGVDVTGVRTREGTRWRGPDR